MKSLTHLYRIGRGPSSSHSMGPERAARLMKELYPSADSFNVTLYGSLAKTGKGHMTDAVLKESFSPLPVEIVFDTADRDDLEHPCAMDIEPMKGAETLATERVYSIGGGAIRLAGRDYTEAPEVYPLSSFEEIAGYCRANGLRLWEYAEKMEGQPFWDHLSAVWSAMKNAVGRGLAASGILPGGLEVQRKAGYLFRQYSPSETPETRENRIVCSYAFAVCEENAAAGTVVTAPTCGSCGVVPAVLYYHQQRLGIADEQILKALATAGVIGNIIKTNASISGAECGCQAEVGTACCMASAGLAELLGMDLEQIEYAAEISMEHMLGLTCDPVGGLVQIPCIERNAVAAMRSINAVSLASFLTNSRKISFDTIVRTMYETGKDLGCKYRETSEGGLAKYYSAHIGAL